MRPPDLPGGNIRHLWSRKGRSGGFNEAAGFTRRKHGYPFTIQTELEWSFNEAAGFTRRKPKPH